MTQINAEELLKKYRLGTLTEKEKGILESWYIQQINGDPAFILSPEELEADLRNMSRTLPNYKKPVPSIFHTNYFKISLVAASVLVLITFSLFYYTTKVNQPSEPTNANISKVSSDGSHVIPGTRKAILTLADNSQIILDSASLGDIHKLTGITISKTEKGQLSYIVDDKNLPTNAPIQYNTITTPIGGEYKIQLADGTVVWLNAMSSIRFPTRFSGNERRVEITGEAYFEVAHNVSMPFRVVGGDQEVEVLGTHFNVNAYTDEKYVKTTLFNGSVKVSLKNKNLHKILKPGDQSLNLSTAAELTVQKVDLEEAVAWKNGYFIFVDKDIKDILRQISRWYDVDIEYKNNFPNLKFGGAISRDRKLSEVLNLLQLTDNVKFKVDGRRVIAMH